MLTFNAIDVETANSKRSSICQIGIVHVQDGEFRDQWRTMVNPEAPFNPLNTSIHGISKSDVKQSPTLPEVRDELHRRLRESVLVSHSPFDRVALRRAMTRYGLEQLQVTWLDSVQIARLAWPDKHGGYRLKNIARDLNISFRHHDALEDARTVAKIVLLACAECNMDIEDWLMRFDGPKSSRPPKSATLSRPKVRPIPANVDGPLYGETIVFTGPLGVSRKEAEDLAACAGCEVVKNVTTQLTILVVGTEDSSRLRGYKKSRKHRRAEELRARGRDIQILSESQFFRRIGVKHE